LLREEISPSNPAEEAWPGKGNCDHANWKGYIQWQGSESRRLALIDLEANQEIALGYRQLYERRPEYYNEFLLMFFVTNAGKNYRQKNTFILSK
jgi:hypothetical protein